MKCELKRGMNCLKLSILSIVSVLIVQASATVAVKMYSFDEGLTEGNISKPRIYIHNVGTEAITNITYEYFFTCERDEYPMFDDYWTPNENVYLLSQGNKHYKLRYVLAGTLQPGQISPENSGNVLGIHYNSWSPWNKTDDHSNNLQSTFTENNKIAVYSNGVKIYGILPDYSNCTTNCDGDIIPRHALFLSSFALFASGAIKVQTNAVFTGGGALGSNTDVEVGSGSTVYGNIISGRNAILRANSTVRGDVYAANVISIYPGTSINGISHEHAKFTKVTIPEKTVTPGSTDKTIAANTTVTLTPSSYKNCMVETNGTLILLPGTYSFNYFKLQKKAKLQFNVAANQSVQINVKTDLEYHDSCEVKFQSHGYAPAACFYTNDTNALRVGYGAKITGVVTAPLANVTMYAGSQCDGAIYAKQITVEQGGGVSSSDVIPSGDPDSDGVVNAIEIHPQFSTNPIDASSYPLIATTDPLFIDNSVTTKISYNYSKLNGNYLLATSVPVIYPANSLLNAGIPLIPKVLTVPSSIQPFNKSGYKVVGQYFEFAGNTISTGKTVAAGIPLIDGLPPGDYKIAVWNTGTTTWDIFESGVIPQSVNTEDYAAIVERGALAAPLSSSSGPVVVIKENFATTVAYFDDGTVFSSAPCSEMEVKIVISDPGFTISSGTCTLNYLDFSNASYPNGRAVTASMPFVRGRFQIYFEGMTSVSGRSVLTSYTIKLNNDTQKMVTITGNKPVEKGEKLLIFANPTTTVNNYKNQNAFSSTISSSIGYESSPIGGDGLIQKTGLTYNYSYFLKDHLGSTRMVLSAQDGGGSEITQALMYQPYGTVSDVQGINTASTDPLRNKFTTKEFDEDGGIKLFYFGARFYDPETGIWLSCDNAAQFWNAYGYPSNPILMVDPDGNFSWVPVIVGAAMGAIQGGMNASVNDQNVGLGILGGAVVGGASGALGSWVGGVSSNAMLSAMASSVAASSANSIGMYALSGGKTDISTSYGPFSMNWSKGKFNVARPTNPMGMLAWFSFMQDINAGLIPYGPQAPGKGAGNGIELNGRKLDWAGGGATDPSVPIRYVEDIPAALGHDPGYVANGVTIRDNIGTVRALGFDKRVIGADFALARSEFAIRNSVLGYLDPISRGNAGLIAGFGIATGTVKSLGYASWFQW